MPRVSLILCVKDGMPYLPEAIDSVIDQTARDFELIVQDGGSTDGSLAYLEAVVGVPRIEIDSRPDSGVAEAYSRALPRCSGKIIGTIDADNLLESDALEQVIELFDAHPSVAAIYGSADLLDMTTGKRRHWVPPEFSLIRLVGAELVPPYSVSFYSRAICGDELRFDDRLKTCQDFDLWLRISHLPIMRFPVKLGTIRLSAKSMTRGAGNYDQFVRDKTAALAWFLDRQPPGLLTDAVRRRGVAGINLWAAESLLELGADAVAIEQFASAAEESEPGWSRIAAVREAAAAGAAADDAVPAAERRADAPRVSLILVTKNGMPYIRDAIESIRLQTYRDFELIVQDGGSTDGTVEFLRSIDDLPAIEFRTEPDEGLGDAYGRALERCRGQIVGTIDSDNLLESTAVERAVDLLDANPHAAALYGATRLIDERGAEISTFVPPEFDLVKLLRCELVPPFATGFFAVDRAGPDLYWTKDYPTCHDFALWLRISGKPILRTTDVLASTRLGDTSLTRTTDNYERFVSEKVRAIDEYLGRYPTDAVTEHVRNEAVAGVYAWAAESIYGMEGATDGFRRFVERGAAHDPRYDRIVRLKALDVAAGSSGGLPSDRLRPVVQQARRVERHAVGLTRVAIGHAVRISRLGRLRRRLAGSRF